MKFRTLYRFMPALVALAAIGAPLADANAQPSFPPQVKPVGYDQFRPLPIAPPVQRKCEVSIGQGRVEYGEHSAGELQPAGKRRLTFGKRTLPLAVTCPTPATLSLSLRGRANTNGDLAFGTLGTTRLTLGDATLDGRKVQLQSNAGTSQPADTITVSVGTPVTIVAAQGTEARGRTLLATLTIESTIPLGSARFTDLTDLSSDAVIEVTEL
ncbi:MULTISPECIES: hypothetical protein [Burkholderia]|uniref:Uncharacterized protein n=1 Tax=Burkholderia pyrrocinia TaxID=60550 RepID=A0A318HUG6_BURPY|nr:MULTISPECIES: hypothetical protein [Burkholderia]PXX22049.1 hypothetical protein NA66_104311 [Burkholderia pyrrocinia]SFW90054.1 hypothetical protein SAMN03159384_06932 [Burkholderia sp. NFACC33-1]SFY46393.1 hypothetical protein SAMN03159408_06928 [Burkholderia sp. NFPP32]